MRISFIGFGEVASAFAPALASRGAEVAAYDVLFDRPDGIEVLRERAGATPVELCALPEALRGAGYVLSTCTTSVAVEAAQRCAAYLKAGQAYVDLNATEPAVKLEVERAIEPSGATFVEGAVLGAVGVTGASTEILLGGPHIREAKRILAGNLGLNAKFYSEQTGKASTFKMLRSVFSKGVEALLIEFLVAGERAGIRADLWREVTELDGEPAIRENRQATGSAVTRLRMRGGKPEMKQFAGVLRQLGIEPTMTSATVAFFERSGSLGLQENFGKTPADMDEVIRFFNARLK